MKPLWYESRGLIPWLLLITFLLAIGVVIKEGLISDIDFVSRKEQINGITKIIGSCVLLIAGLMSYFRFFKGRMLNTKLNILPSVGVIALNGENLHWIDIEIENKGSVAIWNLDITIYLTLHGSMPCCIKVSDYILTEHIQKNSDTLIDVGESAYEHAFIKVPIDYYATTYQIILRDNKGTVWDRCITVENVKS